MDKIKLSIVKELKYIKKNNIYLFYNYYRLMALLSNLLIKEKFDEFNLDLEKINPSLLSNTIKYNAFKDNISEQNCIYSKNYSIIENIDDKNYYVQDNEVKYKIFEDISSILKNDKYLEIVLKIPIENNILSINKIKFSNKINKYIKNIYLNIDNKVTIKNEDIFESKKILSKIIKYDKTEHIINCSLYKNIDIHIILDKDALNYIMNKNIFVNYSYVIFKNKIKFC